jgi:hypothetical protein
MSPSQPRIPWFDPRCFRAPGADCLPKLGIPRVWPLHPGPLLGHIWVAQGAFTAPWATIRPSRAGPGWRCHTLGQLLSPLSMAPGVFAAPWARPKPSISVSAAAVYVLSTCLTLEHQEQERMQGCGSQTGVAAFYPIASFLTPLDCCCKPFSSYCLLTRSAYQWQSHPLPHVVRPLE